jgi:hypothetical protein
MKRLKPLHKKVDEGAVAEPDTGLPGLIRLANLISADAELPHFPDVKCVQLGSKYLDDAVCEREFARFLDENFPRDKFDKFREFFDLGADHPFLPNEMYSFVRETRAALRMIATHQQERSRFNINFHFPWAQVGGWQVDRIRVCEKCGKLFFANRGNKQTCSERCSTARRVQRHRERQSQYEQARKLKSARTTKDSKVKTQKGKAQGEKNGSQKTR